MVRTLLDANAKTEIVTNELGCTPLISAAQEGHDEVVKLLVLQGEANIRARTEGVNGPYNPSNPSNSIKGYHTSLHVAARGNHLKVGIMHS